MPSVVCIDNAEMHVESGRHINLIESIKRCFPTSQIFVSTHSYQISKNFGNKKQLYDLRLLRASSLIKEEPWRLYIADEIKDGISKLKSITTNKEIVDGLITDSNSIIEKCFREPNVGCIIEKTEEFLEKVEHLYVGDLVSYYSRNKIEG
jgi:predicted ATP-binding protein involved in virulence